VWNTVVLAYRCGQFYERGVPFDSVVELIEKGFEKYMRDHAASEFMFPPEFARKNPEVVKRFQESSLNHLTPMRPYIRHVIARQEHETRHLLHKITCPTLVICGAGDRSEGGTGDHVLSSEALAKGIEGSEFHRGRWQSWLSPADAGEGECAFY